MEIKDMTAVQLSAAIKEGKITVSDAVEASRCGSQSIGSVDSCIPSC